ncbi:MAG: pilus assembly protein PilM [Candidatus Babeliales bacterium]|nr:pilus assembly protein PilM [Candidatus Babeliales bacterium]
MIKELFLPQYINDYYLFPTRVVGIDIGKTHIGATQVYYKAKSIAIEKYIEIPLEPGTPADYDERATNALKLTIAQLDPYDYLYCAMASSYAIFKELRVPFTTYETIKKVVQYEVEPMLPFAVQSATIDFVITKKNDEQASSEIVVAAVQNQYIEAQLQLFADAGVTPHAITLDLFALYELYKKSNLCTSIAGAAVLIDLGMQTTRIAYIQDGQLRFIRTISKGIFHQAKAAADLLNMQPNEIMEHMMRFGLGKNSNARYGQTVDDVFTSFWREIQLTLQSFTAQMQQTPSTTILLLGQGAELKGMVDFVSSQLQMPCQLLRPTDLLDNKTITVKTKSAMPSSSIISLATALLPMGADQVNLRQGPFALSSDSMLNRQLIVACAIALLLIGSLATYSYMQIKAIRKAAQSYEKEALDVLKERPHFEKVLQEGLKDVKEKDQLEEAKHLVEQEVHRQEEMWFAFAGSARASKLKYLLELTTRIDKDALGFIIDSLAFTDGMMIIKAQVKNHEALKLLEQSLDESPLFGPVPKQEETNFVMKINLAKNGEEK